MLDWIFGPRIYSPHEGYLVIRALTLEPDTVTELAGLIDRRLGDEGTAVLRVLPAGEDDDDEDDDRRDTVSLDTFMKAHDAQLQRLELRARGVRISLHAHRAPAISFTPRADEMESVQGTGQRYIGYEKLAREAAKVMLDQGKPRIQRRVLRRIVVVLAAIAAIATWLWILISERPQVSVVIGGSLATVAVIVVIYLAYSAYRYRQPEPSTGHFIRWKTREELRQRRWDRRRDIWVAGLGLVGGLLLAVVTTTLFGS